MPRGLKDYDGMLIDATIDNFDKNEGPMMGNAQLMLWRKCCIRDALLIHQIAKYQEFPSSHSWLQIYSALMKATKVNF